MEILLVNNHSIIYCTVLKSVSNSNYKYTHHHVAFSSRVKTTTKKTTLGNDQSTGFCLKEKKTALQRIKWLHESVKSLNKCHWSYGQSIIYA